MGSWLNRLLGRSNASAREELAHADTAAPVAAAQNGALAVWQPPFDVDALFVRWLLDAPMHAPAQGNDAERRLIGSLAAAAHSGQAATLVPRVPAVVPQLLHSLRDPARSAQALARHIAQDPVLVAAVVRSANSPYYRAGRNVESLDQAVLVLGDDGLRQLVAGVAFRPLINVQSGRYTKAGAPRIWDQSERHGAACRLLAPHAGANAFEGYLASLLQNVGNVVALRIFDTQPVDDAVSGSAAFCAAFREHTRELSHAIGVQWSFPESVTNAVAHADRDARAAPLAVLLRTCERLSKLCALADAGWVSQADLRLAVERNPIIAGCFAELDARRIAAAD